MILALDMWSLIGLLEPCEKAKVISVHITHVYMYVIIILQVFVVHIFSSYQQILPHIYHPYQSK